MKLNQLEALIWVSRLRSFRGAAAHLNTTQPGISLRIKALERELGMRLIHRVRGRIAPTPEGKECIVIAEQMFLLESRLRAQRNGRGALTGQVSVGVSEVVAQTWLPKLIERMTERYPQVTLGLTVDLTPPLVRGLETGEFDVVLGGSHRLVTTFPSLELGTEQMAWIGKTGSVTSSTPLRPRDLQSMQIITSAKGAAIYQSIEKWFINGGAYPSRRITCNASTAMADLAAAGLGIALLPVVLVKQQLAARTLSIIPSEPAFEPVRFRAIYAPAAGPLGEIVAKTAVEVSTFRMPPRKIKGSKRSR